MSGWLEVGMADGETLGDGEGEGVGAGVIGETAGLGVTDADDGARGDAEADDDGDTDALGDADDDALGDALPDGLAGRDMADGVGLVSASACVAIGPHPSAMTRRATKRDLTTSRAQHARKRLVNGR